MVKTAKLIYSPCRMKFQLIFIYALSFYLVQKKSIYNYNRRYSLSQWFQWLKAREIMHKITWSKIYFPPLTSKCLNKSFLDSCYLQACIVCFQYISFYVILQPDPSNFPWAINQKWMINYFWFLSISIRINFLRIWCKFEAFPRNIYDRPSSNRYCIPSSQCNFIIWIIFHGFQKMIVCS
jgi:hypothetical protein